MVNKKFEISKDHYWNIRRNQATLFLTCNAFINIIISVQAVIENQHLMSYAMNSLYIATSLFTFFAVFLNYYKN